MKEHQAREIIFETKINKLMQDSGYIMINESAVYGRSGNHDIYSYGELTTPVAFANPLRIIFQYKYYAKNKVDISHIRDFYGIMADIKESNYLSKNNIEGKSGINVADKYTNTGCYISTTSFSREAQEYAWAHDIYLMSFDQIDVLKAMMKDIEDFVAQLSENTITTITRKELLEGYDNYIANSNGYEDNVNGVLAILNGTYPVLLLGSNNWLSSIIVEAEKSLDAKIQVEQAVRNKSINDTKLDIKIKETNIEVSIPNVIVEKLMERKDNKTKKGVMFEVDIPYISQFGKRAVASLEIYIEGFSKDEFAYEQISFF